MRTSFLLCSVLLLACGPELKQLPVSEQFRQHDAVGQSSDNRLQEASGLAASFANPGYLWTHNDSGGAPDLYLISEQGAIAFTAHFKAAQNVDWEDIAIARDGSGAVYVGDIGDNRAVRPELTIYRIVEPLYGTVAAEAVNTTKMTIQYEEGPRDSETLMVDPFTRDLVLLTKREEQVMVYTFPFEAGTAKTITSKGTLAVTQLTAGDINSKGDILLKNYEQIFLMKNQDQKPILDLLLQGNMELVEYEVERQGEALTWSTDDNSFYLLSEWNDNQPQPLYKYY